MAKNNKTVANVPNLRFSGFEEDWDVKKLGEIAQFSKGKGISKLDIVENGTTECIRYGELYTHYSEIIDEVLSTTNIEKSKLVISKKNDVIIPSSGETPLDIAKASCVIKSGIALGGDLNIIKTDINGVFLSYYLNSKKRNEIASLAQGSSVVHLYSKQLSKLNLCIPLEKEQNKLAYFLITIDNRISTQIKILEDYELLKKGMMQKLFKQEFRFKDKKNESFPNWKTTKLDNVVDIVKGKQLNKELLTEKDIYPCQNGGIEPSGFTNMYNTLENTITISEGGNSCGYVNYMQTKFWCGGHCYSLLNIKNNVVNKFLYQYLKFYQTKIMSLRVGSGLPNIQKKDIVNLKISIPCHEEQQKIANILSAIDAKITLETKLLEQYKSQKKYLLQNLFI